MAEKKRVFLIHGWGHSPERDWFPWIFRKLSKKGFEVHAPEMPDTNNPKIENWIPCLREAVGKCDKDTYFIGHSIGCQAIMRYLEELSGKEKAGGAVFVAGWITLTGLEDDEERFISSPWITNPIDFVKIRGHSEKIISIFSDNDPYVPNENWEIFSKELGAEIIIEKNKGHFTDDDGVKELPIAFNAVLRVAVDEKE